MSTRADIRWPVRHCAVGDAFFDIDAVRAGSIAPAVGRTSHTAPLSAKYEEREVCSAAL